MTTNYLLIEPFEVPETLASDGLNGRFFANKVMSQIEAIHAKARETNYRSAFLLQEDQSDVEVEVPGAGMTLAAVSKLLRKILGNEPIVVTGEVVVIQERMYLTTRVRGKGFVEGGLDLKPPGATRNDRITHRVPLAALDRQVTQLAKGIVRYVQPYLLFRSLITADTTFAECTDLIQYALANDEEHHRSAAIANDYIAWAMLLAMHGENSAAIGKCKAALTYSPKNPRAFNNWGVCELNMHHPEAAIACYRQSLDVDDTQAEVHSNWAAAALQQGQYEEAINQCKKAVAIKPLLSLAYVNWGQAIYLRNHQDTAVVTLFPHIKWGPAPSARDPHDTAAVAMFRKAIALAPTQPTGYLALGDVFYKNKSFKACTGPLQQAVRINPANPLPYARLGFAFYQLQDVEQSIANYEQFLRLPFDSTMRDERRTIPAYLSALHVREGVRLLTAQRPRSPQKELARNHFVKALKLVWGPDKGKIYMCWGNALSQAFDFWGADEKFRKALAINPHDDEAIAAKQKNLQIGPRHQPF